MNKKITPISIHDKWDELGYVRRKFERFISSLDELKQPILEKNAKKIRKLPTQFWMIS